MGRVYRIGVILPVVVSSILGVWAVFVASHAGAQSLPASTQAGQSEKFQFKLPYEAGKSYQLQQTVHLEAKTGEYRPDDLAIDMRQVVSATIQPQGNTLAMQVNHIVQRGGGTGQHYSEDCLGMKELPKDAPYKDTWRYRIKFQADLDGAGKLSNPKGAAEAETNRNLAYRKDKAVIAQYAYHNDWFRQLAEEPSLYLPPGKVAVGDKWKYSRTLQGFLELPIGAIDEEIQCRLASVDASPQGQVATIEVSGIIGQDSPGKTCLKKVGKVMYNLDTGALAEHRLAITGVLIRPNLKPADVNAAYTVSLSSGDEKSPAVSEQDASSEQLPLFDIGGKGIFTFELGTEIIQDQSGKVWTLLPVQANAAAPQAAVTYPIEINDPRKDITGELPRGAVFIDKSGRAWWKSEGDTTRLTCIEDGQYQVRKVEGYDSYHTIRFPHVQGVTGHDLYAGADGAIFAAGKLKLNIYDKTGWNDMQFPCNLGEVQLQKQQDVLFRQMGKTLYIARNFEPVGLDAQCSLVACENGGLYDTGLVSTQQVTFLGQHDGQLLVGTSNHLWRLETNETKPVDKDKIAKLIGDLNNDSFKVRQAAARELEQAGKPAVEAIQKFLSESNDAEQNLRIRTVMKKFKVAPAARMIPTKLGRFEMLDFVFQTRDGMQFYRPWEVGKLQPEGILLCTDGGKDVRTIELPRPDRVFQLQMETPDGKIIGRDRQYIFELDPKTLKIRNLFALGKIGANRTVRVVAVKDGQYCLTYDTSWTAKPAITCIWYNPSEN